ncbi:MAG: DEAD/DEAH box helicase, partial [Planctomycetota bacterium]
MVTQSSNTQNSSLWIESGQQREGPVARVAMVAAIEGQYSFAIPDQLVEKVEPGKRLLVPFGKNRKPSPAFCIAVGREIWTSTLKPVTDVLDRERLLSNTLIDLGLWMSRYYCCPLGRTLAAMVPEPIRKQSGFRTIRTYRLTGQQLPKLTAKRQAVINALSAHPEGLDQDTLITNSKTSKGIISAMTKAGLLEMKINRQPAAAPDFDRPGIEPTFELNNYQKLALEHIISMFDENDFRTLLLYGVSGSGKTEVYIRSIRAVLAKDKQAILLVPEIALTTQIVDRLARRFDNVAVIHSGLTGVQRSLTYSAIARGEKRVVIGTRSAVFAPCLNLGLIVIDEPQESSFKNQQAPRFHTREVAVKRAQLESIPIVLGSATPSLETWYNCERLEHFQRITLPKRIEDLPMPTVEFVDMHIEQRQRRGLHLLSQKMEQYLGETLAAG